MKQKELLQINFKESLPVVYEDIEPYLMKELNKLRDNLIQLPEGTSKEKVLSLFEGCVLSLNALDENDAIDSSIDTEEREGLCDILYKMGEIVGLDSATEYLDDWREW